MLSGNQRLAAEHVAGPMMVVAGPGSGKTTVLTERIKNLLRYTSPERICVITFARKAAEEMRERFASLTDAGTAARVCMGTFHSVFLSWLRRWGVLSEHIKVIDEEEKAAFFEQRDRKFELPVPFACHSDEELRRYEAYKSENLLIDFDDILKIMDAVASFYQPWREYDYFLVDEFQDIDSRQYSILTKMVSPEGEGRKANLFIVGDDDQAIYAFRGSEPSLFLGFSKDFPGCRRVDLNINYRSTAEIVETAGRLIGHNESRFEKTITPSHPTDGWHKSRIIRDVSVRRSFDEQEEALAVAKMIRRRKVLCPKGKSVAVLCRTKQEAIRMGQAMEEKGVGFEGREEWLEAENRHAILVRRDMEAVVKLSKDPSDKTVYKSLFKAFPVLYQNGFPDRVPEGAPIIKTILKMQDLSLRGRGELENFDAMLEEIAGKEKGAWVKVFWRTDYLKTAIDRIRVRRGGLIDLILQVIQMERPDSQPVRLMTMHGSKGLEFDEVYVTGLCEDMCPRKEALTTDLEEEGNAHLEEERRLVYVAVTRAKKKLHLSYYDGLGTRPSRFLREMGTGMVKKNSDLRNVHFVL